MSPSKLRFDTMRELYQAQRERREALRNSVATPVAAMAFSIFDLSTLATSFDMAALQRPIGMIVAGIAVTVVLCLLSGATLIVRMERNFVYIDPPDLEELLRMERALRAAGADDEQVTDQMNDLLAGAYDIIYRRYFAANERTARDRTRGLRLILVSLSLLVISFLLLPSISGGAQ